MTDYLDLMREARQALVEDRSLATCSMQRHAAARWRALRA
jgi:hypothetical protein